MDVFQEVYTEAQKAQILAEFSRLRDNHYLEHIGATLYSDIQISNVFKDLKNNLFGNPHAYNTSSKFSEDVIDQIRYQVLDHFNTNPDEYSLIFTSGATAALKLIAENFIYEEMGNDNKQSRGTFMYLEDNHTSVLGMREYAKNVKTLSHHDAFKIFNSRKIHNKDFQQHSGNSLFVYSAQCNFSGTKYPLSWIEKVHNGILNELPGVKSTKWFCMLDAPSFLSSNKLDLSTFKPDFVSLSFYKIFGYPTGLGALLVKNSSASVLGKTYFGGGTVQIALHSEHVLRPVLHERFEDGTLPFLSIASIRHGFETLNRLSLTMDLISAHTFALAKYVHHNLLLKHHGNGEPIAILYHDTDFESNKYQGGIVNFNLLRANGQYIGYSEVLHLANLYKIHFRTGCFCNPGACQRHLKLTESDVKQHFNAGHVCGDQKDLIDGYPTGSIRVSFGYMSTKQDADKLLQMIEECFVQKPIIKKIPQHWNEFKKHCNEKFSGAFINTNVNDSKFNGKPHITNGDLLVEKVANINLNSISGTLQYMFLYPIKSCGAFSVLNNWEIESTGLRYDREWMIVTSAGVCLTQKQEPKMCLITPRILLSDQVLELNFPDMQPISVSLNNNESLRNTEISLCQSKVCGDRVQCFDCGHEVANWLCEALQRSDLRLLRQHSNHIRTNRKGQQSQLSLVNQAQYLLLNVASVNYLANSVPDYEKNEDTILNLIHRFRPNFVVDCDTAFIEHSCYSIRIGNHVFKCTGPCTRCQMICIDQMTGEKTIEPLRTLSVLTKSKIRFGVYLAQKSSTSTFISKNEEVTFYNEL